MTGSTAPLLSILIVTYRTPELTLACVESVFRHPPDCEFEILVLDNAPGDGTGARLAAEYPAVQRFDSPDNVGFARANNLLAGRARGEYLLLLNSDTLVHAGALDALLQFAQGYPDGGIYGGRTVSPSGALDPASCWGRQTLWSTFCFATGFSHRFRGNRLLDPESLGPWRRDSIRSVGVVSGCLALLRTELWRRLDGFDERFWMYGEDHDLAIRAGKLGYRPVITPDALITHVLGGSSRSDAKKVLVLQARVTLMRKHWSGWRARIGVVLLWCGVLLRHLGTSDWGHPWETRSTWMGGFPLEGDA